MHSTRRILQLHTHIHVGFVLFIHFTPEACPKMVIYCLNLARLYTNKYSFAIDGINLHINHTKLFVLNFVFRQVRNARPHILLRANQMIISRKKLFFIQHTFVPTKFLSTRVRSKGKIYIFTFPVVF